LRRSITFSVFFVLFAGAAFAQLAEGIKLYSWGGGLFVPISVSSDQWRNGEQLSDTGHNNAGAGITWGGMRPVLVFEIDGSYQYGGFSMAYNYGEYSLTHNSMTLEPLTNHEVGANFWVKPLGNNWLKFTLGKFNDDTLRGKVGYLNSGFEYFTVYHLEDEDQIFSRFSTHKPVKNHVSSDVFGQVGFMLSSAPIKDLYIGLLVDGSIYSDNWGGRGSGASAIDVYRYIQAGIGYRIGAANVRAQYIGGFTGSYSQNDINNLYKQKSGEIPIASLTYVRDAMLEKPARVEAACSFSGIPNLFLDLGFKAWLPIEFPDLNEKYSEGYDISLGALFRASPLNISCRIDVMNIGADYAGIYKTKGEGGDKPIDSMVIDVRLVPTYNFTDIQVGLDLGCRRTGESKASGSQDDIMTELGFGIFMKASFGNGFIKAGAAYSLAPINSDGNFNGTSVFSIPVILEYSFF
jgi:hypothetical protein